jgi:hypothetical protein
MQLRWHRDVSGRFPRWGRVQVLPGGWVGGQKLARCRFAALDQKIAASHFNRNATRQTNDRAFVGCVCDCVGLPIRREPHTM